jgi:hypothetical protein
VGLLLSFVEIHQLALSTIATYCSVIITLILLSLAHH